MSELKTNKQITPFRCFINCFGMLKSVLDEGYNFSEEDEFRLMKESFKFDRECYEPYLIDKLSEKFRVGVSVESDYLYRRYDYLFYNLGSDSILRHEVLSAQDLKEAADEGLAIVLIDKWQIDM